MTELDTRLAEIDAKLREIQDELAPDGEPEAVAPSEDRLERLTALHASLVASMREMVAALGQGPSAPGELTVSAGPFATVQSLRAFERELATLPGVRKVAVRGYEGEDRALIDVELS